jgi:hypothetical protein
MPLTNNAKANIGPDYPSDDQFSKASLWLHSAGQMAQMAAFSGDERFMMHCLIDLNRAVTALGFALIVPQVPHAVD